MVSHIPHGLRYIVFALPILFLAVAGLAPHPVQAVPHVESSDLVSRSNLYPRSTVVAPPVSNFVLNGLKGQPPQTRNYNFVISELTGAPDGFSKPMLVVNGKSTVNFIM